MELGTGTQANVEMVKTASTLAGTSKEGKKKRKLSRNSGPRSRGGCTTCKIRRVKCDEARPSCLRCQNFGTACDGYRNTQNRPAGRPPNARALAKRVVPVLAPKSKELRALEPAVLEPIVLPAIELPPIQLRFENDDDQRYFSLFRDRTSYDMTPYFESDPFRVLVLQGCNVPAIRHGVVALGALSKTCMTVNDSLSRRSPSHFTNQKPDTHHRYAVKQYTKAIGMMQKSVANGQQDVRTTLLTCLLIICFECFHGNYVLADAQIQNGLNHIESWRKSLPNDNTSKHPFGFSSPAPDIVEDLLIQVFGGLEIQTFSFGDRRTSEQHKLLMLEGTETVHSMPDAFYSLDQARAYLELVIRRMKHWFYALGAGPGPRVRAEADDTRSNADAEGDADRVMPRLDVPRIDPIDAAGPDANNFDMATYFLKLQAEQELHVRELELWYRSFLNLFERSHNPRLRESLGAELLYGAWKTSILVCRTALAAGADPTVYDAHTKDFSDILDSNERVVRLLTTGQTPSANNFTIIQGTIHPPHFVGLCCRVPSVRRRALSILTQWPRREGVCDSVIMAKLLGWLIGIEEEFIVYPEQRSGVELVDGIADEGVEEGYIPRWARVRHMEQTFSLVRQEAEVCCQQQVLVNGCLVTRERRGLIHW